MEGAGDANRKAEESWRGIAATDLRVKAEERKRFTKTVFEKAGFTPEGAENQADVLGLGDHSRDNPSAHESALLACRYRLLVQGVLSLIYLTSHHLKGTWRQFKYTPCAESCEAVFLLIPH